MVNLYELHKLEIVIDWLEKEWETLLVNKAKNTYVQTAFDQRFVDNIPEEERNLKTKRKLSEEYLKLIWAEDFTDIIQIYKKTKEAIKLGTI